MGLQNGKVAGTYFELAGPDDAPALVFSHSLGSDLSMWDGQMNELATSFRLLRYDTRGHGRSALAAGPLALADLGRDVLALLDHHKLTRAHFCGVSLGGMIGQWLGLHAPERLNRLILADTAPRMGSNEIWNARIAEVERGGMAAIAPASMERWFTRRFRERSPEVVARFERIMAATQPAGFIACARVVQNGVLPQAELDRLADIRVPTLVLTGSDDAAAPPEKSRSLAALIPGARFVEVAAAHITPVEASEAFSAALLQFLREPA